MWRLEELVEATAARLRAEADALDQEQAVYGLDARDELDLHPLLSRGFAQIGFGVFSEQAYPTSPKARPTRSERARCDLLLTPSPDLPPADPVVARLEREAAGATLFAEHAAKALPPDGEGCPPEEAFWLEVKTVGQFEFHAGVPGPNSSYSSSLRASAADLRKLSGDRRIVHAGLLLVLFTADEATARHDVVAFAHHCLDKGIRTGSPVASEFGITDRIGHRLCTLALLPVRGGGG